MDNWKSKIIRELKANNEDWSDVINYHATGSLNEEFNDGYGATNGCSFTLWTEDHVYFPVEYDGAESVNSVKRNPCEYATSHI